MPPEPQLVPVPVELLERMTRAMEDVVTEARTARVAAESTRDEARAHHQREEPALAAHHDYLRRLSEQDSQAAAEAKARAESAAATRAAAAIEEEAARAKARASTIDLVLKIAVPLISLALGAGGTVAYLGGSGATP